MLDIVALILGEMIPIEIPGQMPDHHAASRTQR